MNRSSEVLGHVLARTSKASSQPACLALEDGTIFYGRSCGAPGEVTGEICFNTGLVGYLEVITDPSYAGQIVCMTYPQIGNYGVNEDDAQAGKPALRGFCVRDLCDHPSNWRSELSLPEYLKREGIVAIDGIDTRALVRHVREQGAMTAVLSTTDLDAESLVAKAKAAPHLGEHNFVSDVSRDTVQTHTATNAYAFAREDAAPARFNVVAYDCGAKSSILDNLVQVGCSVTVVPWNTPAEDVLALNPDGVFLSNGPGDPETVKETFTQVKKLLGKVPIFGICLGHQMLGKAAGASVEKLKYGHRGTNQPVMNLITKRVEITVQNHGFGLLFPSLGPLENYPDHADDLRSWTETDDAPIVNNPEFGRIQLTHVNLNDGTIEGMRFLDVPAFSVQYHPEAAPGSTDSHYLFESFVRLMQGVAENQRTENGAPYQANTEDDYLAIDLASDRLHGWKFENEAVMNHA